jgi:heptosyltransferase I
MLPFAEAPRSVCLLRLSAIGDTCHVVPLVRTLQQAWPATQLTWIIGKSEARLMRLIEGVEFITVDKRSRLSAVRAVRAQLRERQFDVLLHLQLALRASLIAHAVPARIKLGFDRARARELQWLFTNHRIAPRAREHVLDSFFGFLQALGIHERLLRWDLPLPEDARAYAARLVPDSQATLVISPCSSHTLRNWLPLRYAAVAEHAVRQHGMRVILAGGPSELERRTGAEIERACRVPLTNQIGRSCWPCSPARAPW